MSDKRKRAARALMQEYPDMTYTEALREADRRHRLGSVEPPTSDGYNDAAGSEVAQVRKEEP